MKVVIVGGVAGGASAAARLRRLDERAEIVIFERTNFISYANCGLPYYIGGEIRDKQNLTLQTPQSFANRFNIKVCTNHLVRAINKSEKTVTVQNLVSGEIFEEAYDKLILSPGAKPVLPAFYNENPRTFTLRTVEDTLKIDRFIKEQNPRSAIVIGGGFIGIEMAENLKMRGLEVTILQRGNHLLPTLDCDMACFLHSHIRNKGVNLILNADTKSLECSDKVNVTLSDGKIIASDMVIVCVGVAPENDLALSCGLQTGVKGAISVNCHMQTSDKDIYAVGDAVEFEHFITQEKSVIALAGPANKQGRIAADNICGILSSFKGSQGSSVIKIFDMTAASTGINEALCKSKAIDYQKIIISPMSNASYYPKHSPMVIKLLFESKTFKILGVQIVGFDGTDKRLDVIATAMRAGLLAFELKDLDLCYAPPYSSAKDPVNMLGFVAENIKNGIVKQCYFEDLSKLYENDDVILLDVRSKKEFASGHIDGFINIPLDSLRKNINLLTKKKVYVLCQSGIRSYIAARILTQNNFEAYNFAGGYGLFAAIKNETDLSENCFTCN